MTGRQLIEIAHQFFDAYNASDIASLEALLSEDVRWEHHNRFKGAGRAALIRSIKEIAQTTPGRRFTEPTRWASSENLIYLEHQWHAVPTAANAMFGWQPGVPFSMDAVSVFVFADGKIIEWSDYG